MVFTNGLYIISSFLNSMLLFYALIPGAVVGYILAEYMSAGSKYIALDRLDSLMWMVTWSVTATAVIYLILLGLKSALSLV